MASSNPAAAAAATVTGPAARVQVVFRDRGQAGDMATGYDEALPGAERNRAVQQALSDALRLAQLQVEVLVRLDQADRAGDDEAVLRGHAELDHVMALVAETEQVRTGARAALGRGNDLTCAGCGEAAEPVYDQPWLLGFRCPGCGWEGDDPAAQAERKRAEALAATAAAVVPAIDGIEDAVLILGQRGKRARADGVSALREVQASLRAADRRLQRTGTS
jgi:hypothetical protein